MIIVNGWKPLTITTKRFILDVAAVLDSPLGILEQSVLFKPAESKLKFIKVADLATKEGHHHGCFPGNVAIFLESYSMECQSIFFPLSV